MADLDGDYWFVLLLSRDDLEACGFDSSKVDDETMGKLADAMEEPTAASSMTCGNAPTAWAFQSAAGSNPRCAVQLSALIINQSYGNRYLCEVGRHDRGGRE
jgi:hypothetical protein